MLRHAQCGAVCSWHTPPNMPPTTHQPPTLLLPLLPPPLPLVCCSPDYIASCVNEAAQRRDALRGQKPRTWLVSWRQPASPHSTPVASQPHALLLLASSRAEW